MITFCFLVMILFVSYRSPAQNFQLMSPFKTNITFRNDIRETDSMNIFVDFYLFNGGGVAVGDLNGDGMQDIVFSSSQGGLRFYQSAGNWKYVDRTEDAGLVCKDSTQSTGVFIGDLNGDGLLDIYASRRYRKNRVYFNQGAGRFKDVTDVSPLGVLANSTHAAQIDYDRDGDLDFFLVNNGEARRTGYLNPGYSDKLFRNDGNGVYVDVSETAGITDKGYGLSAGVGDVNDDGWPDIYVANDFEERDKMWINNHDGTFSEMASSRLPNMSWASMGSDLADINGDGMLDIMSVDMLPRDNYRRQTQLGGMSIYGPFFDSLQRVNNCIHLNRGNGQFVNVNHLSGMAATDWSWSILSQDVDLDGDLDVFVSNGLKRDLGDQDYVYNLQAMLASNKLEACQKIPQKRLTNYLFRNDGAVRFSNMTSEFGLVDSAITNGAAFADLDNDGDMDLILNNTDTVAFVYRNTTADDGAQAWSGVELIGPATNTQGIGAKVTWFISSTHYSRTVVRECYTSRGFESTSDARMTYGIGLGETVDSIRVSWSDGAESVQRNPQLRRYNQIAWGTAQKAVALVQDSVIPLLSIVRDTLLPFRHRENFYDDFKRERLLPYRFSKDGPSMAVGDVNGDGLSDVITAGAKYQPTQCFLQQSNGSFEPVSCGLDDAIESEDVDLALVDVDNDKDLDLIVVSGGSEFEPDDEELTDRLYINNGKGQFIQREGTFADHDAGSCVAPCDFDHDGDVDLFIGGRVAVGRFPELAPCRLYVNVKGAFKDATDSLAPALRWAGMTTSAQWVDIDGDRDMDLVVVGEWMTPRVWRNTSGRLAECTKELGLESLEGWWQCVRAADVDGDGDQDLLLGNVGRNCLFVPEPGKPLECFAADFDNNGSIDPIMVRYVDGNKVPTRGRMTLTGHMPTLTRAFNTYAKYATATLNDLITPAQQDSAIHLYVREFSSGVLRNDGKTFRFMPFQELAQVAPIRDMLALDLDGDGDTDIIAVGNNRTADNDVIGFDSGVGTVLQNTGKGAFTPLSIKESGLKIRRDCRKIVRIPRKKHKSLICVTTNSSAPVLYLDPTK